MTIVRSGGIFGLLISLMIAALFMFVVRPAINDTTDRAFETANRAIDEAARQSDDIRSVVDDSMVDPSDDYLSAASFDSVVTQIKDRVGADGELLDLTVSKQGGGNVKYRTGDRAAGFQWGPGHSGLDPVKVTLVGSGKLSDNVFPIAKLQTGATARLMAAVRREAGAGFAVQSMSLGLNPVTRDVRWTVTGERHGRAVIYSANSDASGLERVS
jgi:hypothetical protein